MRSEHALLSTSVFSLVRACLCRIYVERITRVRTVHVLCVAFRRRNMLRPLLDCWRTCGSLTEKLERTHHFVMCMCVYVGRADGAQTTTMRLRRLMRPRRTRLMRFLAQTSWASPCAPCKFRWRRCSALSRSTRMFCTDQSDSGS